MMANGQVKLTDFGIAHVHECSETIVQNIIGTPHFIAPEVFKGESVTFQTDIWSLGIVLYNLCTYKFPFDADCNIHLVEQITTKGFTPISSERYSETLSELIDLLLKKDPKERITLRQIIDREEIKNSLQRLEEKGLTKQIELTYEETKPTQLEVQDEIEMDDSVEIDLTLKL